jgi:predicted house-cleaning noncanonical NTP pyrophosphatase (MazG superfamily)
MSETIYNKLVRDKIPEKITLNGETPICRVLNDEEFKVEALKKLIEEAKEFLKTPNIEERADIAKILKLIDEIFEFSTLNIKNTRIEKLEKRGGFLDKIFLEKTTN